jgi:hypothetical protein
MAFNSYLHTNLPLRLVRDPSDTYLFDELDATTVDEFVQEASVYNKQKVAL